MRLPYLPSVLQEAVFSRIRDDHIGEAFGDILNAVPDSVLRPLCLSHDLGRYEQHREIVRTQSIRKRPDSDRHVLAPGASEVDSQAQQPERFDGNCNEYANSAVPNR